jgi:prepilin-type N-terminal cleavage/methylation domain-containing protein/prepilin-type processing-associated H-X9-DG protein
VKHMQTSRFKNRPSGLTLIELLVVLVVLTVLTLVFFLPPDHNQKAVKARAQRIQCVNNLKSIGVAFRVAPRSDSDRYTTQMSTNQGGSLEFASGPNAFRHFQVMSNELGTPRLLFCPSDAQRQQMWPTNFDLISNSNLSYFVGIDATETAPGSFLSGDRNLTNGAPARNGILELIPTQSPGWTAEMHKEVGNVLFADGSVQQLNMASLRIALTNNADPFTNRLQMPVLTP